jgi:DNA-directed RNA polymerase
MIAVTQEQLEEQIALEREAIAQGLKRLRDNTIKLEQKDYASASIYGVASIDTLLPLVVERIQDTTNRIKEGKVGASFKEIQQYLVDIEPLAAAAIACKLTFDKVFSYKEGTNKLASVCDSIAHAVEDECQMRHYERVAPGLLRTIKEKYWHDSCGTHQKMALTQTLMNRYDVPEWSDWGRANRIKLGAWLLDCIMQASGWFTKMMMQEGRKRVTYVVPTAAFMDIKDEVIANAELFSPLAWPMLVPPNDWSNDKAGGYILNDVMRGHDLVRRGRPCIQGDLPITFLNQIQKVAFCINPFIYEVAAELQERGVKVGKFIPIVEMPLPNKPFDIADNFEARKNYRREAAEVHNINAHSFKASCRTRMTMQAAERFKNRDRFYLPWSFDYRGRAYPVPAFLTPQDTDFGKSLIRFADGSFVTPEAEQWLAFQVATTYGLDKAPMDERLQWVKDNITLITKVATDPLGNLPEWEAVEESWQFLAACEEYYYCVVEGSRQFTSLMVATDATCSGLQILAGLARDASTARLVNVLPSDTPQDAYKVVAEAAKADCPAHLIPYLDRKVTKRVVMTVPYNAKPFSNRGYIREALKEKGVEVSKEDLTVLVKAIRDAMDKIVPGPMAVMKWIETEVAKAIKAGSTALTWTTPSGFVVTQKLMKPDVEVLKLQLLGKIQKVSVKVGDSKEVDINHHKNATAPNLIHSLDASLLHIAATRFHAPIALIHDSVLCRATDMSILSSIVRETYMHLFAEHDYLKDFASQIGAETDPPIIGDLEPESVIESTYFFC